MSTVVAVGAQWGDEGKGKVVDWLASRADFIVRFHGGNNAGHTLVVNGEKTVLHVVPSGVLHEGTVNLIGPGVVVDPEILLSELNALHERGILKDATRVRVSGRAHVIMEWHKQIDRARERKRGDAAIGTTGRGIGPTYEDKAARRGLRVADLLDPAQLKAQIAELVALKNFELVEYFKEAPLDGDAIYAQAVKWGEALAPYIDHTTRVLDHALQAGRNVLFEGAQGTFLDIDHGTYPYVTSSNCVAGAVCTGAGVGPTRIQRVLGITKAYLTRVGGGPFPTEEKGAVGEDLRKRGAEFGATTGRPRRCGWLDIVMLREAVTVNGLTSLVVNKLDVLSGFSEIPVAVGYKIRGKEVRDFPMTLDEVAQAEPIYETLPGWSADISQARKFEDLPSTAQRYIARIEEWVGIPVDVISVGPGRDATIVRNDPFRAR